MSSPLVSVIIPTFNRAGVLARAIDSVLGQTYRPVEVMVVDDGSMDDTPEILKTYGDAIVSVVQDNAGPSAARNRGIRESRGELIAFLDSDDLWLATKLERQVDLLAKAGSEVPCCLCDSLIRMPSGEERSSFEIAWLRPSEPEGLWLNPAAVLATRFVLFSQAVLVRRRFLLDCGCFDEQLWLMEDHDLALRLALRGPWAFIREPLVRCWGAEDDRIKLSAVAQRQPVKLYQSIEYIDRKVLERESPLDDRVRRLLQWDLRGVRRKLLAERWLARGGILPRLGAKGILQWVRLERACFGRSRSYPMAETRPIVGPVRDQGRVFPTAGNKEPN
jgi:glycosyltransferase involved in cell wall biosynthesis